MPLLSVIILNIGGREYLPKLLESLSNSRFDDFEIVIADTEEVDITNSLKNKIVVEKLDKNYGPPGNRNRAFKRAKGEYILFLDNDTTVDENTLGNFIEYISSHPNDIVQLKLVRENHIMDSAGGFIDDLGYPIELGRDEIDTNYVVEHYILYAKGAAMGMSRKVFEELGGFDEDYFYGYADTDLCLRAWKKGHKVVFIPYATVIHYEHGSFSKNSKERDKRLIFLLESRRLYFIFKNFDSRFLLEKISFITFYFLGSMLMDIIKRRKFYAFTARVRALAWVISRWKEISKKRSSMKTTINEFYLKKNKLIVSHKEKPKPVIHLI